MKIPTFIAFKDQMARIGKNFWYVTRLVQLSKDFPVMEVPLEHLYIYHEYERITLREMVMHMKTILDADLNLPIILGEDGELLDGRHRLMKAMHIGATTIKAVRFDENPPPCMTEDEK